MKPYRPRFPVLMILLALGIVKPSCTHAQSHYLMRLTGLIDHRLAIEMMLKRDGKALEGIYFYDLIGRAIRVQGSLSKTGRMQLSEGEASFSGILVKGKRFTGTWRKAKGGKALPFTLNVEGNPPAKREVPGSALLEEKTLRVQRSLKALKGDHLGSSGKQILIRYPVVRGSRHTDILRKLNQALSPGVVYEFRPCEKRADDINLNEIDYDVNYNSHSLLDITLSADWTVAYPDTNQEHVLLNLKTGAPVRAVDVFAPRALRSLAKLVDENFQVDVRNYGYAEEYDRRLDNEHFEVTDLDDFSVGEKGLTFSKGLTFNVEYMTRHGAYSYQTMGFYFYPYTKLRPYIRKDGLLAPFYATQHRKK